MLLKGVAMKKCHFKCAVEFLCCIFFAAELNRDSQDAQTQPKPYLQQQMVSGWEGCFVTKHIVSGMLGM